MTETETPIISDSATDKVLDTMTQLATTIQEKVIEIAPKAFQIIMDLKQMESIVSIIMNLFGIILALCLFKFAQSRFKAVVKAQDDKDISRNATEYYEVLAIVAGLLCIPAAITFGFCVFYITDVWTWVGAIRPDAAIAHDVYLKVMK